MCRVCGGVFTKPRGRKARENNTGEVAIELVVLVLLLVDAPARIWSALTPSLQQISELYKQIRV